MVGCVRTEEQKFFNNFNNEMIRISLKVHLNKFHIAKHTILPIWNHERNELLIRFNFHAIAKSSRHFIKFMPVKIFHFFAITKAATRQNDPATVWVLRSSASFDVTFTASKQTNKQKMLNCFFLLLCFLSGAQQRLSSTASTYPMAIIRAYVRGRGCFSSLIMYYNYQFISMAKLPKSNLP